MIQPRVGPWRIQSCWHSQRTSLMSWASANSSTAAAARTTSGPIQMPRASPGYAARPRSAPGTPRPATGSRSRTGVRPADRASAPVSRPRKTPCSRRAVRIVPAAKRSARAVAQHRTHVRVGQDGRQFGRPFPVPRSSRAAAGRCRQARPMSHSGDALGQPSAASSRAPAGRPGAPRSRRPRATRTPPARVGPGKFLPGRLDALVSEPVVPAGLAARCRRHQAAPRPS